MSLFCFGRIQNGSINTWNVKLSNSQLNKLKPRIKNVTRVTLNVSSTVIGDSNNKANSPHKLLLTNTKVSKIVKLLQMLQQLIQNLQKLNCLKWYS